MAPSTEVRLHDDGSDKAKRAREILEEGGYNNVLVIKVGPDEHFCLDAPGGSYSKLHQVRWFAGVLTTD